MLLKYNYLVSGMSIDYQGGIELWGIRRALRLATSVLNKRCISCQERTQLEEISLPQLQEIAKLGQHLEEVKFK